MPFIEIFDSSGNLQTNPVIIFDSYSAMTDVGVTDSLLVYDASANIVKRATVEETIEGAINTATQLTSVDVADKIPVYDTSGAVYRYATTEDIGKGLLSTATTATIASGDYLLFRDISNSDVLRKDTVSNILSLASTYNRDILLADCNNAKSIGSYQRLTTSFQDGFADSSGINTGSSSNYNLVTASKYLENVSYTVSGTSTDLTTNASSGANTVIDRSFTLTAADVIGKLGHKSDTAGTFRLSIFLRNSAGNYTSVANVLASHTGSGWEDFSLASTYTIPGSGSYYVGVYGAAPRYNTSSSASRAYIGSDATGTTAGLTEDTGAIFMCRATKTAVGNMTLLTTAQIPYASPSTMRVLMEVNPIVAITLNTDLTAEVSANNGTNYSTASLSLVGDTTGGAGTSKKIYESSAIDVSANTGVTGALARIKSFNTKSLRIYRLAIRWD